MWQQVALAVTVAPQTDHSMAVSSKVNLARHDESRRQLPTPAPAVSLTSMPFSPLPSPTLMTTTATLTETAISAILTPTQEPTPTATPTPLIEPTPVDPSYRLRVPVLMYHYLSVPPADANAIRLDLSITPTLFESHLAYLQAAGYQSISLKELYYALTLQTELPPKPIVITFDDGYRDAYENAFPLLKQYNFRATFFIFTQPIDTYNVDFLTWEMIIEMHQAGMEFGSHSYTHPDMRERSVDFLVYQIVGSQEAIEARIGEPVKFFCYPSGRYDQAVIDVLDSAHFWGAVTTHWGNEYSFTNRFEMPRLRMRGGDTAASLAAKLGDSYPP